MTTSEFVKLLQEADPSGEAHIRMDGGVPVGVEHKEGYWDGPYSYIDGDGNYVTSSKGHKVDINCVDRWNFIERHIDIHDPENLEKIKSKFKFDFGNYSISSQADERRDGIMVSIESDWKEIHDIHKAHFDASTKEMVENAKKGWRWFQDKKVDEPDGGIHKHYTWKIYDEGGKYQGGSNIHMTQPVLFSGKWAKIDNNMKYGYYEWVYQE